MEEEKKTLEEAKDKAIKKLEYASSEAKDLVLDTAKRVEIERSFEKSTVNHEQIMERLGGMKSSIDELVRRVGIQNGRVSKIEDKYHELDGNIAIHDAKVLKMYNEKNDIIEKLYQFNLEEKKRKEDRESFIGRIKENWIVFVVIGLTSGFAGTFIPLIWLWLREVFS